jgi:3-methylcrotonyl-CoA carboxylase alpha subunit
MEMNTRLQVEHPVTELVTGQDLVEWQLRVAFGEVFEGGEVSPFYDPMIAKLIVHAPTREAAAAKLAAAAGEVEVWPVRTNAAFLARAAADGDFVAGRVDTGFIERGLNVLVPTAEPSATVQSAAASVLIKSPTGAAWTDLTGFRANASAQRQVAVSIAGTIYLADPSAALAGHVVSVAGRDILFLDGEAWPIGPGRVDSAGGAGAASDGAILSPMPGRVISVDVEEGQAVVRGQKLLTLEAMKMEHGMTAPFDGVVRALAASVGAQVSEGTVLARIAADVN